MWVFRSHRSLRSILIFIGAVGLHAPHLNAEPPSENPTTFLLRTCASMMTPETDPDLFPEHLEDVVAARLEEYQRLQVQSLSFEELEAIFKPLTARALSTAPIDFDSLVRANDQLVIKAYETLKRLGNPAKVYSVPVHNEGPYGERRALTLRVFQSERTWIGRVIRGSEKRLNVMAFEYFPYWNDLQLHRALFQALRSNIPERTYSKISLPNSLFYDPNTINVVVLHEIHHAYELKQELLKNPHPYQGWYEALPSRTLPFSRHAGYLTRGSLNESEIAIKESIGLLALTQKIVDPRLLSPQSQRMKAYWAQLARGNALARRNHRLAYLGLRALQLNDVVFSPWYQETTLATLKLTDPETGQGLALLHLKLVQSTGVSDPQNADRVHSHIISILEQSLHDYDFSILMAGHTEIPEPILDLFRLPINEPESSF